MIHTDEVYFRDTANGFLAWAVALVISVTFLASAAASRRPSSPPCPSRNVRALCANTGLFRAFRLPPRRRTGCCFCFYCDHMDAPLAVCAAPAARGSGNRAKDSAGHISGLKALTLPRNMIRQYQLT
jgi:hypothetical protein